MFRPPETLSLRFLATFLDRIVKEQRIALFKSEAERHPCWQTVLGHNDGLRQWPQVLEFPL
jgi:hypothetical protein